MKYLYIPKRKSIIVFLVFLVASFFLNLLLLLTNLSMVDHNFDMIIFAYTYLPILYSILFCMLFSYLIHETEMLIEKTNNKFISTLFRILILIEICSGILIIFIATYIYEFSLAKVSTIIFKIIPFENLISNEYISDITLLWSSVFLITPIACSIIMFVAAKRQSKIKNSNISYYNQIETTNQTLGYDYTECDFYQQVKIPYQSLMQTDGTRGEFEVYHMLRTSDMADSKYIFNREVPKNDGLTTELDLILIHNKGIFVIENKHYTTRVFGKATDYDLTIIDHKGKKTSIYNPIKQNENHVSSLKDFLKINGLYESESSTPIYSIVVFTAENDDHTDNIISGISVEGTNTKVCTSPNVYNVIQQIINNSNSQTNIDTDAINDILLKLPIRKKYS